MYRCETWVNFSEYEAIPNLLLREMSPSLISVDQTADYCLFISFINPNQEKKTQFHKGSTIWKKDKTTVWIKWPTQGRATYM